jgi:hypothetical protein
MPMRFRDLERHLRSFGVVIVPPTGGGSHYKAKMAGKGSYPIPAHNGPKSELTDLYVRKACAHFGVPCPLASEKKAANEGD